MSYGQPNNKRARADQDEIISAGLNYSTDETYLSTNIVNLSYYDGTPKHGLPANFTQSRTSQIIGNTKRSDVGIAYAEIQTKTLPVFQPQVLIGEDRDALIYEVGTSAVWSGCLLNPSLQGSTMCTLAYPSGLDTIATEVTSFTSGQSTLEYKAGSLMPFTDSYGNAGIIAAPSLSTEGYSQTLLRKVFTEWSTSNSQVYTKTPLKPVAIPSVYQHIRFAAPLLNLVSMSLNNFFVVVDSVDGFEVGDKCLVFGMVDSAVSKTDMKNYYVITSISKYSDMVNGGGVKKDPFLTPNINSLYVLVFASNPFGYSATSASGGYVINTKVGPLGGRIDFLMDEFEFYPRDVDTVSSKNKADGNYLKVQINGTPNEGFLRQNWNGVVEIQASSIYKGLYQFTSATPSGGGVEATLTPLNNVLPTADSIETVTIRVAPNFFNFQTRVLSYPTSIESNETKALSLCLQFMKCFGYQPTSTLDIPKAQYPPRCTGSTKSWRRAFTPDFFFSAYRGLRWSTQDVDVLPAIPKISQDFGSDSGSSYYNVYDFKSFVTECVNPAFSKLLFEPQPTADVPLTKVQYVSSTQPNTTFTVVDTFGFSVGSTFEAKGFPLHQSLDDNGNIIFTGIDGVYTVVFLTGTTLICNNPNGLPVFTLQPYTGLIGSTNPQYLSNFSLNTQLYYHAVAYQIAYTSSNSSLLYNSSNTYQLGDVAIYQGEIYIANTASINAVPGIEQGDHWYFLGKAKNYSYLPGRLRFVDTAGGPMFYCSDVSDSYPRQITATPRPQFHSNPVKFSYESFTNLISFEADSYAYGDTNGFQLFDRNTKLTGHGFEKDDSNINYSSWGSQNATGSDFADEYMSIETNSSFKFLMDNFCARSIRYVNPETNGLLIYWIWQCYTEQPQGFETRRFTQAVESISSCLSPVQSIVILSKTIPVVQTLLSPATVLSDVNSSVSNVGGVTGDSDSIVGEFYIEPGMLNSCKSVIRYRPDQVVFYSLQSTKTFKQVDYNVCYRHRVTQKLVPLVLSNYGNINIKFVFKPT